MESGRADSAGKQRRDWLNVDAAGSIISGETDGRQGGDESGRGRETMAGVSRETLTKSAKKG